MKNNTPFIRLMLASLLLAALRSNDVRAQEGDSATAPPSGGVVMVDQAAESTWAQLSGNLNQLQSQPVASRAVALEQGSKLPAVEMADRFQKFHTDFPGAPQSKEAQKLEALLLIDAVGDGAEAEAERMEALVASLRSNLAFTAAVRAEVAATYEYRKARTRINAAADVARVYEEIARALMVEFPDQPQGSGSLLTLADNKDEMSAMAIAQEIIGSPAPEEVKGRARAMVKRKAVVGRRVDDLFGDHVTATKEGGAWSANRPSIIYFWAAWSAESLAVAATLREFERNRTNILGVCLDADVPAARIAAKKAELPGRLIYMNRGMASSLATDLGVVDVPTVFLSNREGVFVDVKALDDISAKIQALDN